MTSTRFSGLLATGVCVLALATAAGCGDDPPEETATQTHTAASGEVFNDADVAFATAMIPHHAQAIEMVTLTQGRPLAPAVASLATQIRDAQVPEVEAMTDWLLAWDREVPETSLDHANAGHGMDDTAGGHVDGPGMMSSADMTALAEASDPEFEDRWLQMMIEHHRGAIEMARAERADGTHPDALALAETIETTQQAEIDELQRLLDD